MVFSLGATRYIVKRATTSGGPYATIAPNVKGAGYTDMTALNGTTYYYVVSAANSLGESGNSNEASATPHAPANFRVSSMQTPPPAGAGHPSPSPLRHRIRAKMKLNRRRPPSICPSIPSSTARISACSRPGSEPWDRERR